MTIIRTTQYINSVDLPDPALVAFTQFVRAIGHGHDAPWYWVVGQDKGHSFPGQSIGMSAVADVDRALLDAGIKNGAGIDIYHNW